MKIHKYVILGWLLCSMNTHTQQERIHLEPEKQMEFLHALVNDLGGATAIDADDELAKYVRATFGKVSINANTKDTFGFTALMYAALVNSYTLTDLLLLQQDIDLATQDEEGKTALTYAHENRKTLSGQDQQDADVHYQSGINKLIISKLEHKAAEQRKLNAAIEEQQSVISGITLLRSTIVPNER